MNVEKARVGVFDSGIGGLTVLNACVKRCPSVCYLYLGDNENAPYGNRREAEIYALTKRGVETLIAYGAQIILLACNTATALCIERLRAEFSLPILGIEPAIAPAVKIARNILVLATCKTAESERLKRLQNAFPDRKITLYGCPDLAQLIEKKRGLKREEIAPRLPKGEWGAVVLGCTHYSFLREQIAEFYGVPVLDGNEGIARRLQQILPLIPTSQRGDRAKNDERVGFDFHYCKVLNHTIQNGGNLGEKCAIFAEKGVKSEIYFLGSSQIYNKYCYEQMFTL